MVVGIVADVAAMALAGDHWRAAVEAGGGLAGFWAGTAATGLAMSWSEVFPGPGTVAHAVVSFGGGCVGAWAGRKAAGKVYDLAVTEWWGR